MAIPLTASPMFAAVSMSIASTEPFCLLVSYVRGEDSIKPEKIDAPP